MAKGLIINEDVWTLLEDYEPEEALELLKCLAAYHRGEDVPQISRYVKAAYQRIVLDNGRFDPVRRAELSAKRAEAGKKGGDTRWQNIAKIANDSKNSKLPQEEKRIEEIRIDKNREERRFAPPTVEQVEEYAREKGLLIDANRFVDYFTSNGWKVGGKAPMKDWRAAVRNWAARAKDQRQKQQPYMPPDTRKTDYTAITRDLFLKDLKGG